MDTISGGPGWKTTEFWGKMFVQLVSLFGAVKGFLPANYALFGSVGLEAVYNIGRIIVKAVADVKAAKVVPVVVTPAA